MNPDLDRLHSYPFEKLATLKSGVTAPDHLSHISLSIGEPRHPPPQLVLDALVANMDKVSVYPNTRGCVELRESIAQWLRQRFVLPADALDIDTQVLPVNGTREALFAIAQAVLDRRDKPVVVMPNPFYQIYEGAALLAGAQPWYLDCTAEQGFIPNFDTVDESVWERCQLVYLCSPGNPSGAVMDMASMQRLIELAQRHDFIIASDECYAEIYRDEQQPPPGLLQAAAHMGLDDFRRCIVFHSLSKRSNLPGLRSGFVAGDKQVMQQFFKYRTYHGCAMPMQVQMASIAAWQDEHHVIANRAAYREKFAAVAPILETALDFDVPAAGFYLWARTPTDDTAFCRDLYQHCNLTVLPGSYLGRGSTGNGDDNPGSGYVRIALVPGLDECREAAGRIATFAAKRHGNTP
jgi:N-succinyldiaminopimelate aminotransferase